MKILPNYSWEAKAVLTLAAFAKEFGDMLHLDQANANDQLTKSLAILKGSLILPNTPQLRQKRQNAVVKLNDLLKETLEVMKLIFKYCTESPQRIAEFLKPINVYWIIITVIACANEVTLITNDE